MHLIEYVRRFDHKFLYNYISINSMDYSITDGKKL